MVSVPPYLPTLGWYEEWFRLKSAGSPDDEAIAGADSICRVAGKDFARAEVGDGQARMFLSVAVEGGSSGLKRRGAERYVRISGHGNWPHHHIGALEAIYGRAPYFQHVMPGLRALFGDVPQNLSEFNRRLHDYLSSFLQPVGDITVTEAVNGRREEMGKLTDRTLSIIDALMRFGPETSLLLIPD